MEDPSPGSLVNEPTLLLPLKGDPPSTTLPLKSGSESSARREPTCNQAGPWLRARLQQDDYRLANIKARLPHLPLEASDGVSVPASKLICGCTSAAPPVAPRALLLRSDVSAPLPRIDFVKFITTGGFQRIAVMCEYTHRSLVQQRYTISVPTCSRKERKNVLLTNYISGNLCLKENQMFVAF